MPASSGNAGGNASTLPRRRLSRGRWRTIDYEREQGEFERLRAFERHLKNLNWYRTRHEEGRTERQRPPKQRRPPTRAQKLREGLVSGRFRPPNADTLLTDLDAALDGDREARGRVMRYLEMPGVLEVLDG